MVLYRNQRPVNFIFHLAELHIGSSIRYENTLFKNIFFKCYIVKRNLISFNCLSEYILCKYITHVYHLKNLLDQGGEHVFIRKNEASPFVYLQSEVLNAFCTFRSCASILIRQIESDILR